MTVRLLTGDCRTLLSDVPSGSVRCVVTSPPYFGLRDYGVEGQIGLEKSVASYIRRLVVIFREVRRTLASDGTLWLNLGDSYAGSYGAQGKRVTAGKISRNSVVNHPKRASTTGMLRARNVKPKDLYGMPWRLAFALQKDGWYLRQDIIWSKPNPMPESVTDRCTKAHEYLFLLTKSRRYHFNADAIREPLSEASVVRLSQAGLADQAGSDRAVGKTNGTMKAVARGSSTRFPSGWNHGEDRSDNLLGRFTHKPRSSGNLERKYRKDFGGPLDNGQRQAFGVPWIDTGVGRNKRSVWTIATQPFKEAHFATMPPALVEPCLLAGTEPGDLVMDPFSGSGTVGLVADRMGRDYLGIDLNPKFTAIAHARIIGDAPLFHRPETPACD